MQWLFHIYNLFLEPDSGTEEPTNSDATEDAEIVDPAPVPPKKWSKPQYQEITELLDQLKWDDAGKESLKLVDAEPENARAYLTLGDALSRYLWLPERKYIQGLRCMDDAKSV